MTERPLTRRRFGAAAIAAASVAVAGCLSGDDGGDEFDTGEQAQDLVIRFEDEDGDPVSQGIRVSITNEAGDFTATFRHAIEEGQVRATNLSGPGEYTVTVESLEDEFDPVEETVELEAADEGDGSDEDDGDEDDAAEITVTLEGATSDPERAERENGDGGG